MKQTIVLSRSERNSFSTERIVALVRRPIVTLSRIYSSILGERVTVRQTLLLCNAQLSFLALLMANSSVLLRLVCLVWFGCALLKCKSSGLRGDC